jgi:hypothetical protein
MPIPVVPLVAFGGLAALLFAGSKEGSAPASSPSSSATPTQATTGGANGGATMPSHSDTGAQGGEVNFNVGGRGERNEGYLTAPTRDIVTAPTGGTYTRDTLAEDLLGAAAGAKTASSPSSPTIQTGQESAFSEPVNVGAGGSLTGTKTASADTGSVGSNVLRDYWNNTMSWSGAIW